MRHRSIIIATSLLAGACTNDYQSFETSGPGTGGATGASATTAVGGAGTGPASSSSAGGSSTTGAGASGGGGGGGPGGAGGSGLCPAYQALRDDFEDGVMGPQWVDLRAQTSTVAQEVGGKFEISIGDTDDSFGHYVGYGSAATHDLTGCEILIAVDAVPNPAKSANAYLGIFQDEQEQNGIYVSALQGYVRCRSKIGTVPTTLGDVPFDAVQHHWWRVRESGGQTQCETSPDGASWTVLGGIPTPVYVTSAYVRFGAGAYGVVDNSAGHTVYDHLNEPP